MDTVAEIYIKWYEKNYPGTSKECQRIAKEQLENSKIQKFIKKTRSGNLIKGYRILDLNEEKNDDEEYFADISVKKTNDITNIKKESAIQLHKRLCKEYDEGYTPEPVKPVLEPPKEETEPESDSDIESIIKDVKDREPASKSKWVPRENNIEVQNLDANGIKKLPPKKKPPKKGESKVMTKKMYNAMFANMGKGSSEEDSDSYAEKSDRNESEEKSDSEIEDSDEAGDSDSN